MTVPEQPNEEINVTAEDKTLKDVELPAGWVWKAPETGLIPGDYMEAIAVYKDGNVITERTIRVGQSVEIIDDRTDTVYVIGKDTKLTVTCTGELSALQKVEMDGTEVPSTNYQRISGSTILIFQQSYMDTLSEGSHTIILTYPVGSVSSIVQVSKVKETTNSDTTTNNTGTSSSVGKDEKSPDVNTGDKTNQILWIISILLSGIVLTGAFVKRRKRSS